MTVKPKFFDSFKCLASKCSDTCCAGWEIYVDGDTAAYYASLDGVDGEFVRAGLNVTEEGMLLCREGERCPFLNGNNLCELILRLGEDSLCDICREHPRFYCESGNLLEDGLGLCCVEASRLWLESPVEFELSDDGYEPDSSEMEILDRQMYIISALVKGEGTLGDRLAGFLGEDECGGLYDKLRELYSSLEVLDADFPKRFRRCLPRVCDERFSNLAAYFVFRYYFELGEELCLKFTAASLIMIAAMDGELISSAKDYSKEIEYDTDNVEKICDFLEKSPLLGKLCKSIFI